MSDMVIEAMSAMASEKDAQKTPDLVASGLVKVYGDRTVVNGMNVRCSCGEIVGILGPNGAGKTTTFYMVVGLVKPEAGKVEFRGGRRCASGPGYGSASSCRARPDPSDRAMSCSRRSSDTWRRSRSSSASSRCGTT